MNLSKLPRLSQSPEPPPSPLPAPQESPTATSPSAEPLDYSRHRPNATAGTTGAEVWISAAIGLILMYMASTFGTYLISRITQEPFHTGVNWIEGPKAGQEVGYWELEGMTALTHASMWLFGLAMVFDAAVLYFAAGKRVWLVALGFVLTLSVTAFNAFVCAKLFSIGIQPLMSLLATAFGVYMAIYQWRLLNETRAVQAMLRASTMPSAGN
jgi:hypothetical protein